MTWSRRRCKAFSKIAKAMAVMAGESRGLGPRLGRAVGGRADGQFEPGRGNAALIAHAAGSLSTAAGNPSGTARGAGGVDQGQWGH